MSNKKKSLGLWTLTSLVAGNMIGSGLFLLPANLASIGTISLLSWVFTALGAFLLAVAFTKMSLLVPKTGGPYAYAQAGFGDFIGFQTAFSYWLALLLGNAAVVVAATGYLTVFFPILHQPIEGCLLSIILVWIFTLINLNGLRSAGITQLITTILKFIPIALIIIFGWWYFHPHFLIASFNVSGHSNSSAFLAAIPLTLWSFIGLESATIPANNVDNPQRNIPLATLLGTLIASVIYIASSTVIMGMIPAEVLAKSASPFAAAAGVIFGSWGKWLIAAGAVISCLGALNGWVLLQGQVPFAAAVDKLFPKIFAKLNKAGVPGRGLVISSIVVSVLLFLTISPTLVKQFELLILMTAFASLLPYLYTSIAEIILLDYRKKSSKFWAFFGILAAAYAFFALFCVGQEIVFYGLFAVLLSIPFYAYIHWQKKRWKK
jgi:APA family basic amino acid/polyamine antiporter